MARDDSQSDTPGFPEFHPSTTGTHVWTSRPLPQEPSFGSASPPRSQTWLSFFSSGAPGTQSHLATQVPEPQVTTSYMDQSASLARQTSSPTFAANHFPAQYASRPLHTHYNRFSGQYAVPSHLPPFQSQPFQPPVYHGYHPLESQPYPPTTYYPLPPHPPPPYFRNGASMEGSHPPYHQAQHRPPPIPPPATSIPPSHIGLYGDIQHYLPPPYGSIGHYRIPQRYQGSMGHWYHTPGSSTDMFPGQAQQHYPISYARPPSQCRRRGSNTFGEQSTDSERLPSPRLGPSDSSIVDTTLRDAASPPTVDQPEQASVQDSSKVDTREASTKLAVSTSHAYSRPPARRPYHPNLPPHRSEWVMWVGNVPNDAIHDELWRFLKNPPMSSGSESSGEVEDSGVVSIFLISRSNCAFVNYQSEEQLNRAITQCNGRQLRPDDRRCPRLVCRARRKEDDLRAGVGAQRGIGVHTRHVKNMLQKDKETVGEMITPSKGRRPSGMTGDAPPVPSAPWDEETPKSDTVEEVSPKVPTQSSSSYASTSSSLLSRHFPKRFFILKSLTQVSYSRM